MAGQIAESAPDLALDEPSKAYFLNPDGSPQAGGHEADEPGHGQDARCDRGGRCRRFYTGAIAQGIVDATATASGGRTPPDR